MSRFMPMESRVFDDIRQELFIYFQTCFTAPITQSWLLMNHLSFLATELLNEFESNSNIVSRIHNLLWKLVTFHMKSHVSIQFE